MFYYRTRSSKQYQLRAASPCWVTMTAELSEEDLLDEELSEEEELEEELSEEERYDIVSIILTNPLYYMC